MKDIYVSYVHSEDIPRLEQFVAETGVIMHHLRTLQSMPYTKYSIILSKDELTFLRLILNPDTQFWIQEE